MAEFLFRKIVKEAGKEKDIEIASAGILPATDLEFPLEARQALAKEGVDDVDHRPKGLTSELLAGTNLLLVMEKHHRDSILQEFPEAMGKVHLLKTFAGSKDKDDGVADPYGQSAQIYEKTLSEIKSALMSILNKVP
ncbi:hypothetical protein BVX98_07925 [bacterium F11]|nr:hypothetical protein BVX98_07925 [bacterium F11]